MGNASCSQNSQLVEPRDGEEISSCRWPTDNAGSQQGSGGRGWVQVTTSPGPGALNKLVTPSESPVSSLSCPSAGAGKALSKGRALVRWDVQSWPQGASSPDGPGVRWGQKWAET